MEYNVSCYAEHAIQHIMIRRTWNTKDHDMQNMLCRTWTTRYHATQNTEYKVSRYAEHGIQSTQSQRALTQEPCCIDKVSISAGVAAVPDEHHRDTAVPKVQELSCSIIGRSCRKYHFRHTNGFVVTNSRLLQPTRVCHDKTCLLLRQNTSFRLLSWQKYACCDKTVFVVTKCFCHDKHVFVATSMLLLQQKTCFVAT